MKTASGLKLENLSNGQRFLGMGDPGLFNFDEVFGSAIFGD